MSLPRVERVQTPDGAFDLTVWLPEAGTGPGLLLIQEIFGVSDYIRAVAGDLAGLGYVVAAPDLFWRLEPGYAARHDEAGVARSLQMGGRFDLDQGVGDSAAALAHLRSLPEVTGGTGIIGFCLGGSIAYLLAAQMGQAQTGQAQRGQAGLAAAVSFYGSVVPGRLELLAQVTTPVQFHFGGSDPYIPRDQVASVEQAVQQAAAGGGNVEIHVQEDAGHAFHNRMAPMFHAAEPAARAWRKTEEFLRRHLPVRDKTASH